MSESDREFLEACRDDRGMFTRCADSVFKNKIGPNAQKYKPEGLSWREYYLRTIVTIYEINKIFPWRDNGDPEKYYHALYTKYETPIQLAKRYHLEDLHSFLLEKVNIELAKKYVISVQTNDQATLGAIISPDVVWYQPGNNQFSGTHHGMTEVGAMIGKMMEVSKGTFKITRATSYMSNGDYVAINLEFFGKHDGLILNQTGVDLLRFKDGKIVEVRLFSSNQLQEDKFWGWKMKS